MRFALRCVLSLLTLVAAAAAGDLPEAPSSSSRANIAEPIADPAFAVTTPVSSPVSRHTPEQKLFDLKFLSLAIVSTGSTFGDSYTTLFARENWLAGKKGVCNMEVESAYLYGTHPTVGRAYAVASVKSATSLAAAYMLRKHHSKLWTLPLVGNSVISLQGVTQNMINCN